MKGTRLLPIHSAKTIESDRPAKQKDEKEEEHDKKPCILHLPDHIMVMILCQIPTKKLLQFRCVCKSFRCLLSDPEFTKDLFSRTRSCFLIPKGLSRRRLPLDHFLVDLKNSARLKLFKDIHVPQTDIHVLGSFNGIVCILGQQRRMIPSLYISNPITRESLHLPTPPMLEPIGFPNFTFSVGFGFCPRTDVYKVVVIKIPNQKSKETEVMVMTVGSGIWRSIGNIAYRLHPECQRNGVYLNGFLHWIVDNWKRPDFICALDLERECFQQIPLPPVCGLKIPPLSELGVSKGRLSITLPMDNDWIDWVTEDYGIKSWTQKLQIFSTNDIHEGVEIDGVPFGASGYVHTPSVVSLKDVIGS